MNWRDRYRAALVEIDPIKLLNLIHETEVAMNSRSESSPTVTNEELQEMNDATCTLRILKSHTKAGCV